MASASQFAPSDGFEPKRDRRIGWRRIVLWFWRGAAGALALLAVIWLVLFITKGRFLKPTFERIASGLLNRKVSVGGEFNLYFAPIDVAFRADGLQVASVPWASAPDLVAARHVALRLRSFPLLIGHRRIAWLDLDGARIAAEWDAAHRHNNWTFGDPAKPGKPFELPTIERGTMTDTQMIYRDPVLQFAATINIHPLHATNTKIDDALAFDGTGSLRGQGIAFNGQVAQPDRALFHGGAAQLRLHGQGLRTVLDLNGEMPGLSEVTAGHYHLAVRGDNLADLFKFLDVSVVPTRGYHLTANMAHEDDEWAFTGIKGVFGDSDLAGALRVALRDAKGARRLHLGADLVTRDLDLLDAAPFVGYDPHRLDAMGTKGLVKVQGGHPRILPDAALPTESLRKFDADVRYRVGAIRGRNFPVSTIDVTLKLDHGLLTLDPASAIIATGRGDARVVLDARGPVALADYDLRLHPTPMGKLLYRFGVEESGTSGTMSARVAMRGRGNSVRDSLAHADGRIAITIPAGTMWARNVQLSELDLGTFIQKMFEKKLKEPVRINCGLLGFTVRDGVSQADPVLIDTTKNVITGRGSFSFRDESIAMSVKADGKKFSLFSLQSPVGVGGWFAKPGLRVVTPQLLARLGVGGALGAVVNPFAALIAFVDPGDAKAAACGPVLSGARASAQRTVKGKPRGDLR